MLQNSLGIIYMEP